MDTSTSAPADPAAAARERLGGGEAAVEEPLKEAASRAKDAARARPYVAIGIAAAAGVALGLLLGRK
jgi:ElaB/YqjD/DUF883 family membrane-anchored ribosome-binding protein